MKAYHAYFAIDWTIVWNTATRDVPDLGRRVMAILEREHSGPDEGE